MALIHHSTRFLKFAIVVILFWLIFFPSSLRWQPFAFQAGDGCNCESPVVLVMDQDHPQPLPPPPEKAAHKPPKPKLGTHKFRADGLVEVNPDGRHPIFELMAQAEKDWKTKLEKASTSLDEAVAEYRRRYRRNPPKGFDDWWRYAFRNNVQLPDEYDTIYNDLEHFWGIKPTDLQKTQLELEDQTDSYTIGKTESTPISVVKTAFTEGRYDQLITGSHKIVDLLKDVEDLLPPFRITLSPHDGPNMLTDYGVQNAALEAAHAQLPLSTRELPKRTPVGWVSACPPESPARSFKIDLDEPPPPKPKSFIYNHRLTMDPCLHPDLLWHHGQFLSHNYGPTPQETMVPLFSYCTTTIHHNIHIPTPYGWVDDVSGDPTFDEKSDERLLWRGSNTGMFHRDTTRWWNAQRIAAVRIANEFNGTMSVLFPKEEDNEPVGLPTEVRKARINPAIMDLAFAGGAISCAPESYCKFMEDLLTFKGRQSIEEAGSYKYVLDMDGNGWSGRFKRLITTNSLIFKATIYPEWFHDRVMPWLHYVPIQVDHSDLYDAFTFFRGDASGNGAHEDLGRRIAVEGRNWSKTYWRREDLVAYFFRLVLEYVRLTSLDRDAMGFKGDGFDGDTDME